MKKNCKLFVAILALCLVALVFVSCGDTKTNCEKDGHTWDEGVVTKAATCTEKGVKTLTCSVCNETKTEDIAPAGHTGVVDAAVPATCTTDGKTEGEHCSVCNVVITEQEVVPKTGHIEVLDPAVPATCTVKGKTEGSHCPICGTVVVAQSEIPTIPHTFVSSNGEVAPTCTENGMKAASACSTCGLVEGGETIPATGHTFVNIPAVEATCTAPGRKAGRYCSVCAYKEPGKQTIMLRHLGVEVKEQPATCSEDGHTAGKICRYCGEWLEGMVIKATGHIEVADDAVAATCSATGLTAGSHCSVCNKIIVAQTETPVDPEAHVAVTDAAVPATCVATGLTEGSHCSACSKTIVAQTETPIDPEAHVAVTDDAVPATCVATGLAEGSHCSACTKTIVAQTETPIDPNAHRGGTATTTTLAVCEDCGTPYGNYLAYADINFSDGALSDSEGKVSFVNHNGTCETTTVSHKGNTAEIDALVLAKSGDYVDCTFTDLKTSADVEAFVKKGFTVEAFYVLKDKTGAQGVICAAATVNSVSGGWGIAEKNSGKPYFITGKGATNSWASAETATAASTTELVHVVGVFDNSSNKVKVYVNGVFQAEAATGGNFKPLATNSNMFCLGAGKGSTSFASKGMVMVDAKIYETALSAEQVTVSYNEAVASLGSN